MTVAIEAYGERADGWSRSRPWPGDRTFARASTGRRPVDGRGRARCGVAWARVRRGQSLAGRRPRLRRSARRISRRRGPTEDRGGDRTARGLSRLRRPGGPGPPIRWRTTADWVIAADRVVGSFPTAEASPLRPSPGRFPGGSPRIGRPPRDHPGSGGPRAPSRDEAHRFGPNGLPRDVRSAFLECSASGRRCPGTGGAQARRADVPPDGHGRTGRTKRTALMRTVASLDSIRRFAPRRPFSEGEETGETQKNREE